MTANDVDPPARQFPHHCVTKGGYFYCQRCKTLERMPFGRTVGAALVRMGVFFRKHEACKP